MLHECICPKPLERFSNGNEYHKYNCPQRSAAGLMCHKHFEKRGRMQWEVDKCEDCQRANKENAERIQRTQTIDPNQPYGQHIALTCKNHPDLRWSTKNIDFLGARSIFYFSEDKPECACPFSDLIVVKRALTDEEHVIAGHAFYNDPDGGHWELKERECN
jgi:hypothetical protein